MKTPVAEMSERNPVCSRSSPLTRKRTGRRRALRLADRLSSFVLAGSTSGAAATLVRDYLLDLR